MIAISSPAPGRISQQGNHAARLDGACIGNEAPGGVSSLPPESPRSQRCCQYRGQGRQSVKATSRAMGVEGREGGGPATQSAFQTCLWNKPIKTLDLLPTTLMHLHMPSCHHSYLLISLIKPNSNYGLKLLG